VKFDSQRVLLKWSVWGLSSFCYQFSW